jgi:predicted MFS family arabinose efflux permease
MPIAHKAKWRVTLRTGTQSSGQRAWVGVQNGVGNISGIIGPVVTGLMIDWTGDYAAAFWLAAAVTLAGALWWGFVLPHIRLLDFD